MLTQANKWAWPEPDSLTLTKPCTSRPEWQQRPTGPISQAHHISEPMGNFTFQEHVQNGLWRRKLATRHYTKYCPTELVIASQPWGRCRCYSHFTEVDTQTRGGEGHTVTRGKAGIPIHVSGLRSLHQRCQSQPSLMSSPSFLPRSRAFCYTTAQKFWSSNLQGSCVCPPHPLNQELLKGTARF